MSMQSPNSPRIGIDFFSRMLRSVYISGIYTRQLVVKSFVPRVSCALHQHQPRSCGVSLVSTLKDMASKRRYASSWLLMWRVTCRLLAQDPR